MSVSQAVPVAQQSQNKGLPVPGPRQEAEQPGVGSGVREVDAAQPVLQGPGVGIGVRKVDMGQPVPVLQGPATNVPNLQLTMAVAAAG